jgi:hypothetical protein
VKNSLIFDPSLSDEELRGFSRTVAEIEWLTVILVLLYQVVFSPGPEAAAALALGTLIFGGFVLGSVHNWLMPVHSGLFEKARTRAKDAAK